MAVGDVNVILLLVVDMTGVGTIGDPNVKFCCAHDNSLRLEESSLVVWRDRSLVNK
jgi:hypothetical protein